MVQRCVIQIFRINTVTNLNVQARPSQPGPEVIKLFSCSTQLSMIFSLLLNMKMPTMVGIFIFISRENIMLSYVQQERICNFVSNLRFVSMEISSSAELNMKKSL